jgi:hypothetical protein
MVPAIWLDESGTPRRVRRWLRCGRKASVHCFRLELCLRLQWGCRGGRVWGIVSR